MLITRLGRTITIRVIFELGGSDHSVMIAALREANEALFADLMKNRYRIWRR